MTALSNRNAAHQNVRHPKLAHSECNVSTPTKSLAAIAISVAMLFAAGCGKAPPPENSALAKANALLVKQDYDAALESVDAVLTSTPDDYQALILRGQINLRTNKLDEAIEDFTRARDIQPTTPDAYQFRYQAFLKKSEDYPTNSQPWIAWSDKASADHKEWYRLDITSVAAQKHSTQNFDRSEKLIEKTNSVVDELNEMQTEEMQKQLLAQASDEPDPEAGADSAIGGDDANQTEDPFGKLVRDPAQVDEKPEDEDDANRSPLAIDWKAEQEANQAIRERDLASNEEALDDEPLEHGDDPEESEEIEVLPQITRNDLGAYLPQAPPNSFGGPTGFGPATLPTTGLNGNQSNVGQSFPNTGYGRFATGTTGIVSTPSPQQNASQQPQTQPARTTGLNPTSQPGQAFSRPSSPVVPPWAGSPSVTNANPTLSLPNAPSGQTGLGTNPGYGRQQISSALPGTGFGQRGNQFGQPGGFGVPNGTPFAGPAGFLSGNVNGQQRIPGQGIPGQQGIANRQGVPGQSGGNGAEEGQSRLPKPKKLTEMAPVSTALQGTGRIFFGAQLPQTNPYYPDPNRSPTATQVPAALLPEVKNRTQ